MVSSAFKKSAAMQGTSKLCDGRVVGVQKTNPLCFVVVAPQFPWGMTASGRPATPFRSIAVDPSVFPLGRWYYVAALDGLTLPAPHAGAKHDGCVRADDTGGAVKGNDVDLFVGPKDAMTPLVPLLDTPLTMAPGDSVCGGNESF
jgi:3D (Asp-Asp-Asp) domain-containing protein